MTSFNLRQVDVTSELGSIYARFSPHLTCGPRPRPIMTYKEGLPLQLLLAWAQICRSLATERQMNEYCTSVLTSDLATWWLTKMGLYYVLSLSKPHRYSIYSMASKEIRFLAPRWGIPGVGLARYNYFLCHFADDLHLFNLSPYFKENVRHKPVANVTDDQVDPRARAQCCLLCRSHTDGDSWET